jgi:hypothetical protein
MSVGTAVVGGPAGVAAHAKQRISKKKALSKSSVTQKTVDHPKYSEMIHQALTSLNERGGSSRQALLKYIVKNFNVGADENVVNKHLKVALKAGVRNTSLKQSKGSGAAGSFRIGEATKTKMTATASTKKQKVAATSKTVMKRTKPSKSPTKKAAGKKTSMEKKSATGGVKKIKAEKKKAIGKSAPVKTAAPVKQAAVKKTPITSTSKSSAAPVRKKSSAATAKKA